MLLELAPPEYNQNRLRVEAARWRYREFAYIVWRWSLVAQACVARSLYALSRDHVGPPPDPGYSLMIRIVSHNDFCTSEWKLILNPIVFVSGLE